jgi:hypothetical protein
MSVGFGAKGLCAGALALLLLGCGAAVEPPQSSESPWELGGPTGSAIS